MSKYFLLLFFILPAIGFATSKCLNETQGQCSNSPTSTSTKVKKTSTTAPISANPPKVRQNDAGIDETNPCAHDSEKYCAREKSDKARQHCIKAHSDECSVKSLQDIKGLIE